MGTCFDTTYTNLKFYPYLNFDFEFLLELDNSSGSERTLTQLRFPEKKMRRTVFHGSRNASPRRTDYVTSWLLDPDWFLRYPLDLYCDHFDHGSP